MLAARSLTYEALEEATSHFQTRLEEKILKS